MLLIDIGQNLSGLSNQEAPKSYVVLNLLLLIIMESPAFFYTIFLWCFLLSITGYSIYVGFGPPSKQLRDPFEDHED